MAGFGATYDSDAGFGDVEVFGEELDEGGVGFAVVGFGAQINGEFGGRGGEDFLLRRAGFDGDIVFHMNIITFWC